MFDLWKAAAQDPEEPPAPESRAARAGKRTLTMQVPARTAGYRVAQAKLEVELTPSMIAAPPATGGGTPLPDVLRATMEAAFATDFTAVRVHTDSPTVAALGARAYASGDDLHFAPGHYAPGTGGGDALIGHELAHVVQQRAGRVAGASTGAGVAFNLDPGLEAEADDWGARAARGERVDGGGGAGPAPAAVAQAALLVWLGDGMWGVARDLLGVRGLIHVGQRCRLDGVICELVAREGTVFQLRAIESGEVITYDVARDELAPRDKAKPQEEELPEEREPRGGLVGLLGEFLTSGEYTFNNPPLDSSGDIYHTLGFMACLAFEGLPLPKVVIGYFTADHGKDKTEEHADRAIEFAVAVGFGDRVRKLAVPRGTSSQMNAKLDDTRRQILKDDPETSVLDQKVSTALIARIMQWAGTKQVMAVIAQRFSTYNDDVPYATRAASRQWIDAQLRQIETVVDKDKRLVLFSDRKATNQEQHNSEGPEFTAIRQQIAKDETLAHYTIRCHDEGPDEGEERSSSPAFVGAGRDGSDWTRRGFNTKVQHVQLLLAIKELLGDRLIGIYGSTSGTLDVAALVGIRTLSLHEFPVDVTVEVKGPSKSKKRKPKSTKLNEQDQRELLMAPFKDVLRRTGAKAALVVLEQWIAGTYTGPTFSTKEIGGLRPLYQRVVRMATVDDFDDEPFEEGVEWEQYLPDELFAPLTGQLSQREGNVQRGLEDLTDTDDTPLDLVLGSATGAGMNCLIHTMVQLADGAPGGADARVTRIREAMIATGTAQGDEMLDPYQDGAGAALMSQFRRDGHFATQILQWQGGRILVHPVVGNGAVRLLLHRGNHFVPVWGNGGNEVKSDGHGGVAGSIDQLDPDLQRAIEESLKSM
ncbi:MAG: DUF4157 domain-containing protein [Myxococcales bacterium]|nr:DUF4157 domain-containing protein [Myxococcales bacterium]